LPSRPRWQKYLLERPRLPFSLPSTPPFSRDKTISNKAWNLFRAHGVYVKWEPQCSGTKPIPKKHSWHSPSSECGRDMSSTRARFVLSCAGLACTSGFSPVTQRSRVATPFASALPARECRSTGASTADCRPISSSL